MTKKYIILGIIILLVIVGAVVWQNTENTSAPTNETSTTTTDIFDMEPIVPEAKVSTEGWKTCRNEEYGYEFKFPSEWHIYGKDALSNEPKPSLIQESKECNGPSVLLSTMTVDQYKNGKILDAVNFHIDVRKENVANDTDSNVIQQNLKDYVSTQDLSKSNMQTIQIQKQLGILQIYNNVSLYDGKSWKMKAIHNEQSYDIYGNFYEKRSSTIHTILSTFRFLNTATSAE